MKVAYVTLKINLYNKYNVEVAEILCMKFGLASIILNNAFLF